MTSWILNTNPDDYRAVRLDTKEEPCRIGWTVASAVRRGDVVALYGHGSNKTFGFVGIVLTDPVKSLADGHWWSWIEFVATPSVSLDEAKHHPEIGNWPSFTNMRWGARKMSDEYWLPLVRRMLRGAVEAKRHMTEWPKVYAEKPDLPSLLFATRDYGNTDGSGKVGELKLQEQINRVWIKHGRGREIDPLSDAITLPRSFKLGSAGFADIILVDLAVDRTLQVIEVKRAAKPGAATDGVTQLCNAYLPWLKRAFPDWEIRPILIALSIGDTVFENACREGIECWEFDPDQDEFYER